MNHFRTRLIFIPDSRTFILLESPLPAEDLTAAVLGGHWRPPGPYAGAAGRKFHVSQQGEVVMVTMDERSMPSLPAGADLSARQLAVLQCLAQGMTNKQIARQLGMSERTVFNHQTALKESLGVSTLAQAAAVGTMLGLCQPLASGEEGN